MTAYAGTLNQTQRMDTTAAIAVALTVVGWASAFPAIRAGLEAFQLPVSAGAAGFIINVSPIFTAIMAMALLGERFSGLAWLGTLISFAGIGIIAMADGQGLHFNTGALLVLGS
ncbi:MAG: EamA/RhaT family transporter, partial [Mesorhizobium sp.]